jgi:predicted O-methyltransferase YrrM
MITLENLADLANSLSNIPDDRPNWLGALLAQGSNPYHRFIFEVSRLLKPALSWEIGSCDGAGAGHLAEGHRDGLVITVDISPDSKKKVDDLFVPNVVALLGDSIEVLDKLKWKPQIDLLFIDGEHSRRQVEAEYLAYRGLMRPGGIILMDDIAFSQEMAQAWDGISDPKMALNELHFSGFGVTQIPLHEGEAT